mmetsp:Transcript_53423/g.122239  ORF Transcript_53423/g.122239 Transcript_53423/m.122239 type:complete len:1099 (+) Transcript_53423:19-3315(+)
MATTALLGGYRSRPRLDRQDSASSSASRAVGDVIRRVSVALLPGDLTPDHNLRSALVVLIQHRSTATAITALGSGANAVRFFGTVHQLTSAAEAYARESVVLSGELRRGSLLTPFPSFDKGLSPVEHSEGVKQKTVLVRTKNGSRAMFWVRDASIVALASLQNATAVVRLAMENPSLPIVFVCGGVNWCDGRALEDEIICTYLLQCLTASVGDPALLLLDDTARMLLQDAPPSWQMLQRRFELGPTSTLLAAVASGPSRGDSAHCLEVDSFCNVLPVYLPSLDAFVSCPMDFGHQVRHPLLDAKLPSRQNSYNSFPGQKGMSRSSSASQVRGRLRVLIVRHGEYVGMKNRAMAGITNPGLSERGVEQAKVAADWMSVEPVVAVFSSPLLRCTSVAELVARPHGLVPQIDTELCAIDRGDWSGLTVDDVQAHFPGQWEAWCTDRTYTDHGGESFDQALTRARALLHRVRKHATPDREVSVVLVTHLTRMASIIAQVTGQTQEEWLQQSRGGSVSCGSILVLELSPESDHVTVQLPSVPGDGQSPLQATGVLVPARTEVAGSQEKPMSSKSPWFRRHDDRYGPSTMSTWSMQPGASSDAVRAGAEGRVISVVPLPKLLQPQHNLRNSLVVLIDVLRTTSTVITAMGEGLHSAELLPNILAVKQAETRYERSNVILGGEQQRAFIPGFDKDNSPLSYLEGSAGKTGLFVTTNGTRAVSWVRGSKLLVLGSFLNVEAVVKTILFHMNAVSTILLVCSGTDRGQTRSADDELCAGAILRSLIEQAASPASFILDDTAAAVLRSLQTTRRDNLSKHFQQLPAAMALADLGLQADVDFCIDINRYASVLPVLTATGHFVPLLVHYAATVVVPPPVLSCTDSEPADTVAVYVISTDRAGTQLTGRVDPRISAAAREDISGVLEILSSESVGIVATSPLRRAREVAQLVATESGASIEIYNGLSAVDYGEWTGLTPEQVDTFFPGDQATWLAGANWAEHDGESWNALVDRQWGTFAQVVTSVRARGDRSVVVVTHQSTVRSILTTVRGWTQKDWSGLDIPQGSVTCLHFKHVEDRETLECFNVQYIGLKRQDFQESFVPRAGAGVRV